MREHVGRPERVWQVAEVMNVAYGKAATVQNAEYLKKKWPVATDDGHIFQDCDFFAAASNDVTEGEQEHNHPPPAAVALAAPPLIVVMEAVAEYTPTLPVTTAVTKPAMADVAEAAQPLNPALPVTTAESDDHQDKMQILKHAIELSPLPEATVMIRKRKGVTTHACEHTGSPYKKQLPEKNENTNTIQSIPKKKKLLHTESYYDERLKRNVKIDNEPSAVKRKWFQSTGTGCRHDNPSTILLQPLKSIRECTSGCMVCRFIRR